MKDFQAFEPEDLRRLAFFMATGSGKTLLLHVNLWQVLYYLNRGRHPEALVNRADRRRRVDFSQSVNADLLDLDALFAEVAEYKACRRYGNVFIPRDQILSILRASTLYVAEEDLQDPSVIQEGALKVLRTYLDRFVAVKEREAEAHHLEPAPVW